MLFQYIYIFIIYRDPIFFGFFFRLSFGIFSAFLFRGLKQEGSKEATKEERKEERKEGRKEATKEGRKKGRKEGRKK